MSRRIDFLVGLTETELLTIKANATAALVSGSSAPGSTITSVSTRDLSVTYGSGANGAYSQEEILQAARYALQKLDPDTYGTDLIRRKVKWVS